MKVYDYSKVKNCLICGSINGNIDKFIKKTSSNLRNLNNYVIKIHPKELERLERIKRKNEENFSIHEDEIPNMEFRSLRSSIKKPKTLSCGYDLTESVIIVDGCNCFGGRDLKYYYEKLEMFNKVLSDNNTHVLFIRGNDDPKYFEDALINFSNIKAIQDYSVVKLNKFNCLCIGGCTSIDRAWKIEQEKRIGRKMYWDNEEVCYNEGDIDKIIKDYNIACMVTTSCPSFAFPGMNTFKHSVWASKDKSIVESIANERLIMDNIYNKIIARNKKPYVWVYSRFNSSNQTMINDILFCSLNSLQFFHFNEVATSFFNVDFSKTLKENEYVAEKSNSIRNTTFIDEDFNEEDIELEDQTENNDEGELRVNPRVTLQYNGLNQLQFNYTTVDELINNI